MKRSTDRILTTHAGSLARPKDLLEIMDAKLYGKPYDRDAYVKRVRTAVADVVRKQVECGIDSHRLIAPKASLLLLLSLFVFAGVERLAAQTAPQRVRIAYSSSGINY